MVELRQRCTLGLILLWLPTGPVWASYGQMRVDLTPLLVLVAAALGLMSGLADVVLQKHRGAATLWLGGVLLFAACMAGLGSVVDAGVLLILALILGFSAAAMLLPGLLHLFYLRARQRMVLLLGASVACFLLARQEPPTGKDLWSAAAYLLPWGLLTGLAGERPRAVTLHPTSPGAADPKRPPMEPKRAARVVAGTRSLMHAVRQLGAAMPRPGAVGQIGLLSLLSYLVGGASIAMSLAPLDGILLAFAGVLSLGAESPPFDPDAGLAYWKTFGMVPSVCGGLLLWLVLRWSGRTRAAA